MVNTVSYSLNLNEMADELPWSADKKMEWAHRLTLNFMMIELGNQIATAEPSVPVKVAFIHDRSPRNGLMLQIFDRLMADPTFSYKKYFLNIAPMGWEDCIPLQAADLMAYENFKESERVVTKRNRRYTLKELLSMGCFSGRSCRFDRAGLRKVADAYKAINPQW